MSKKMLENVRVVSLSNFIAAPACARFFADLGADVIKVETMSGDTVRYNASSEGRPSDPNENTTFDLENCNKRAICLNTRTPEGMEALNKLIMTADVFITHWRTDALKGTHLDYETLKAKNPKLVFGQIRGFGDEGPDKDLPGYDFTAYFARGGWSGNLHDRNGMPLIPQPGMGDHQAGLFLAAGVMAALYNAKATGEGEKVTVSLFHSAVYTLGIMIQAAQYGQLDFPTTRRDVLNPLMLLYKTKDERYIQICVPAYTRGFAGIMKVIGREDMIDDKRFCSLEESPREGVQQVYDAVSEAFATKTVAEWSELLTKADIPFSLAQSWEEVLKDEQAWANNVLVEKEYYNGNKRTLVRQPIMYKEMGLPPCNDSPRLGEHSEEILAELGYTGEQIAEMKAKKVYKKA